MLGEKVCNVVAVAAPSLWSTIYTIYTISRAMVHMHALALRDACLCEWAHGDQANTVRQAGGIMDTWHGIGDGIR